VAKVCETFGTKYHKTPIAHSHEHNGKVENANRQVLRSVRAFVLDERVMNDWTRALPAVQFIFNTTRHRDIGFTSAELLFGPAVNLNRFVLDQRGKARTPDEALTWWDEQQEIHADILTKASKLQLEVDLKRIELRSGIPTTYEVGTYVLVEYPKTMGEGRGRPVNKLQTTRKGPMRVVSQQDDTYELLDLVSRKIDTVHVSRIYPFKYDSTKVDPENVAIRDQGEFIVESIIDSIIDKNLPRTTWSFRVRWLGFDDTYDEWLGWN
jgi:hypothetical protein